MYTNLEMIVALDIVIFFRTSFDKNNPNMFSCLEDQKNTYVFNMRNFAIFSFFAIFGFVAFMNLHQRRRGGRMSQPVVLSWCHVDKCHRQ